ncbi:MAG: glycosyltransferase [Planctomycetes bacterium]|nr:glycosyltransferase [Planctomycetota bacterium]
MHHNWPRATAPLTHASDSPHARPSPLESKPVELSFVIPVFNSEHTLAAVVDEIGRAARRIDFEIVLVNDGSVDQSAQVAAWLQARCPKHVAYVELAENSGEHSAVLAGLRHARGRYAVIVDDDGQHSPTEALRLWRYAIEHDLPLVYSRYGTPRQSFWRRLASTLHNRLARRLLGAPRGLYLSSFKVLARPVIDQMVRYHGARPFIDALALRAAARVGQLQVQHLPRLAGQSNYNLRRLLALWCRLVFGFTRWPLGVAAILSVLGALAASLTQFSSIATGTNLARKALAFGAVSCLIMAAGLALGWLLWQWRFERGRVAYRVARFLPVAELGEALSPPTVLPLEVDPAVDSLGLPT